MENASKALIIAGAILLSIAIIGIGMYVFQMAQSSTEGVQLTTEQATAYNQKFLAYEGTKRGSEVKVLCNTVRQHNLAATDDSGKVAMYIGQEAPESFAAGSDVGSTTTQHINNNISANIQSGKTYNISFGYDSSSGYVTAVYINEKTNS